MAYACPVCETIAPDAEHLAHHLAIVGMTRSGEHAAWLDEHAAGWQESSPQELAATATEHAEQVEHELADEAAGGRPDVGHAHDHGHGAGHGGQPGAGTPSNAAGSDETAAVLAEAREMTQRMLEADEEGADGDESAGDSDERGTTTADETGTDADAHGDDGPGTATETDSDE